MKNILITGMSGTGKSTVIQDLSAAGYPAADLDTDAFSTWIDAVPDPEFEDNEVKPGKDWVWHEERVSALLSRKDHELLFVSGCASNMAQFYPCFAHIILLTAPDAVIVQRLQSRSGPAYGQLPEEITRVLRLKQDIEPLLRESAGLEIDTSLPRETVIDLILRHTGVMKA